MKFVRFNQGTTGLLVGDQIIDVISSSESLDKSKSDILDRLLLERGKGSWNEMIIHWDEAKEPLNELNSSSIR